MRILMKHILEKRVLFYGVIVRTFWMTLVFLSFASLNVNTLKDVEKQTFVVSKRPDTVVFIAV